jgi:hypothetical protein
MPDVQREFNDVAENSHQKEQQQTTEQTRGIATAAELEALKNARERPVLEPHLTIGGTVEQEVHTRLAKEREAQIRDLEERLNRQQVRQQFNDVSQGRAR